MPKDTQTRKSDLRKGLTTALTWSLAAILDPGGKEGRQDPKAINLFKETYIASRYGASLKLEEEAHAQQRVGKCRTSSLPGELKIPDQRTNRKEKQELNPLARSHVLLFLRDSVTVKSSPRTCFLITKSHSCATSSSKAELKDCIKEILKILLQRWRGILSKSGPQFMLPKIHDTWEALLMTTNAKLPSLGHGEWVVVAQALLLQMEVPPRSKKEGTLLMDT
nr:uncharacterized protein LOC107400961 [Peromyscus maniculatus bairdii]